MFNKNLANKALIVLFVLFGMAVSSHSQDKKNKEAKKDKQEQNKYVPKKLTKETAAEKEKRLAWWVKDRFGMFIHWGIYSLAARHEWIKTYEKQTNESYQKYFDHFNPDLYDPKKWAKMAKQAGMKYAVITTKHHDGFCLFDSKYTDYKSTNTAYGKDIIKEWVAAFRAEEIKIGFYYSLIDWHHPNFTIDNIHPQRNIGDTHIKLTKKQRSKFKGENITANVDKYIRVKDSLYFKLDSLNLKLTEKDELYFKIHKHDSINKSRDMAKYRRYLYKQVEEILTNYGKIDVLWLDYSYPNNGKYGKGKKEWDSKKLLKLVRKLQPEVILNDRLDLKDYEDGWDFVTPEQFKVSKWPERRGKKIPWETCQTFSGSWGYYRDEYTWKDTRQLLNLLIESVSKGGNLLLNVGPTGRGNFDDRAKKQLKKMGKWMHYNGRSIYGCTQAPEEFIAPENTLLTYNREKNILYIHLLEYPLKQLKIKQFQGKIKYAQFLHDGSEIKVSKVRVGHWVKEKVDKMDVMLDLPVKKPNVEIPVIELFLN